MNCRSVLALAAICGLMLCACAPKKTSPPSVTAKPEPMSLDDAMTLIDRRDDWTAHPTINVVPRPMRGPLRICMETRMTKPEI